MLVCRLFPYRINIYEVYSITLARMTKETNDNDKETIYRILADVLQLYVRN